MSKKVKIVAIPQEARDLYNTDPELRHLRGELWATGGVLGALTRDFRSKAGSLRKEIAELQGRAKSRKVELVRGLGLAFASLEELNQKAGCRLHSEAGVRWNPAEMLVPEQEGRLVKGKLMELKRYELLCSKCHLVRTRPPDNTAYACPNCGIVRGEPQVFHEAGERVFDDTYHYYHCRLCGEMLGCVIDRGIYYP